MAKHRLIFTLLVDKGTYVLSRNFRLQRVGDLKWIKEYYDFNAIAFSIDELIVLNVERGDKDIKSFGKNLELLTANCFMPVAAGGGIKSVEAAFKLFDAGADKIVINTSLVKDLELVRRLVKIFGGQSIIGSIDYKLCDDRQKVFIENGSIDTGWSVEGAVRNAADLGVGEIYLTSMDRDGTGQGYDLETLKRISAISSLPMIASGGVGRFDQLAEGIKYSKVQGVSTANLFNFIADGLTEARSYMRENGIDLAEWKASIQKDDTGAACHNASA